MQNRKTKGWKIRKHGQVVFITEGESLPYVYLSSRRRVRGNWQHLKTNFPEILKDGNLYIQEGWSSPRKMNENKSNFYILW